MGASEPTPGEVGHSLAVLGNYRVLRAQQLVRQHPDQPLTASEILSLGLRETGGLNICGGARFVNGIWVNSFTDRGWLQISDQIPENLKWLRTVPGCPNGMWQPQPGHTAADPMYCPRFTDAALYTLAEMGRNATAAREAAVGADHITRFCIAAHNAGFTGALDGYRQGNVDLYTAHGDYSAWVLRIATIVHQWVVAHPGWVYSGQPL